MVKPRSFQSTERRLAPWLGNQDPTWHTEHPKNEKYSGVKGSTCTSLKAQGAGTEVSCGKGTARAWHMEEASYALSTRWDKGSPEEFV